MYERQGFFTPVLSLVVRQSFLSIENGKKVIVRLTCEELITFVRRLTAEFSEQSFCIPLGNESFDYFFNRDKITHGQSCEEPISPLELNFFVKGLIKSIPHMLASDDLTSFVGVASLISFVNFLADKKPLPEAAECVKSLKSGRCDPYFAAFVDLHKDEEKAGLGKFLFFHAKIVESIFSLKTLFKKPAA
jgi:hypothetical protein